MHTACTWCTSLPLLVELGRGAFIVRIKIFSNTTITYTTSIILLFEFYRQKLVSSKLFITKYSMFNHNSTMVGPLLETYLYLAPIFPLILYYNYTVNWQRARKSKKPEFVVSRGYYCTMVVTTSRSRSSVCSSHSSV